MHIIKIKLWFNCNKHLRKCKWVVFSFFFRLIGPAVCLPGNGTHKQRLMQTNSKKKHSNNFNAKFTNIITTLMLKSQMK